MAVFLGPVQTHLSIHTGRRSKSVWSGVKHSHSPLSWPLSAGTWLVNEPILGVARGQRGATAVIDASSGLESVAKALSRLRRWSVTRSLSPEWPLRPPGQGDTRRVNSPPAARMAQLSRPKLVTSAKIWARNMEGRGTGPRWVDGNDLPPALSWFTPRNFVRLTAWITGAPMSECHWRNGSVT